MSDGRQVSVYVKTRRRGDWETDTRKGRPRTLALDESEFWLFVDLAESPPAFFVAPAWWVENDIHEDHQAYLAAHGGQRARRLTTHHRITTGRVEEWRNRWDLLQSADHR